MGFVSGGENIPGQDKGTEGACGDLRGMAWRVRGGIQREATTHTLAHPHHRTAR